MHLDAVTIVACVDVDHATNPVTVTNINTQILHC